MKESEVKNNNSKMNEKVEKSVSTSTSSSISPNDSHGDSPSAAPSVRVSFGLDPRARQFVPANFNSSVAASSIRLASALSASAAAAANGGRAAVLGGFGSSPSSWSNPLPLRSLSL